MLFSATAAARVRSGGLTPDERAKVSLSITSRCRMSMVLFAVCSVLQHVFYIQKHLDEVRASQGVYLTDCC